MKTSMKIEINKEQPLDEVVRELERLGFKYDKESSGEHGAYAVGVWLEDMTYCTYCTLLSVEWFETTTLDELRGM